MEDRLYPFGRRHRVDAGHREGDVPRKRWPNIIMRDALIEFGPCTPPKNPIVDSTSTEE